MQPANTHSAPARRAPVRWNRARRAVAAALATVFAVLLPASVTSAWIRGTILSTSGYVTAVTPVAASPAVRAAVQDAVTSQVDAALRHAETSLPPSARVLAGRLGTKLAGLARNGVSQLMASQAFQRWWADANRLAHSQLISVLNGDSAVVTAAGGEVVLYLLTTLAAVGALAASPRRRRTLLQMTIGGTLAVLTLMTAVSWGQSSLIDRAAPRYQAVTSVIVHALTAGFFTMTTWCVAGGVAITAIALLTARGQAAAAAGPGRSARSRWWCGRAG
jgi:hypothetical protein